MWKNKMDKVYKVMSLNSSAFSDYFHMLMTVHNIDSIRNGTKVLIFYFCCEIISSHIAERALIFKPIIALIAFCIFTFIFAFTANIEKPDTMIAVASIMVVLCMSYTVIVGMDEEEMMESRYSLLCAVILMMYTLFHLRFLITMLLSMVYILFFLSSVNNRLKHKTEKTNETDMELNSLVIARHTDHEVHNKIYLLIGQIISFIMVYITGLYLRFFNSIRRKSAFLKLAQNAQAKIKMNSAIKVQIYWLEAIMPSAVKDEFLSHIRSKDLFNLAYCKQFTDVSILFADIVGFTAMSSNKSAKQLVYLLNDLYNRFDKYGKIMNCEKIATLGDCYYCVSGCPVPRSDHAMCCIEMGLGMCKMIMKFNQVHREEVNMRVGVHSGRVIAAIIGNSRFRFDVYSNDVVIANDLESSGKPGKVHISEVTYRIVRHAYTFVEGETLLIKKEESHGISGLLQKSVPMKTYFVKPDHNEHIDSNIRNVSNRNVSNRFGKSIKKNITTADRSSLAFRRKDEKMKSDLELIRNLQRDPEKPVQFFQNPPIHPFTLTFEDVEIESHYQFHTMDHIQPINIDSVKLALMIDAVACQVFSTLLLLASYVLMMEIGGFHMSTGILYVSGLVVTWISSWVSLVYKSEIPSDFLRNCFTRINHPLSKLLIIIYVSSLPSFLVLTLHNPVLLYKHYEYTVAYFTLTFFALISNCLCSASYSVIKHVSTAGCTALALYILLRPRVRDSTHVFETSCTTYLINNLKIRIQKLQYFYAFQLIQICLLIYFLTRENEKNIRIFFYAQREADIRNDEAKREKKVAEGLLYNIIPKYVFIQIQGTSGDQKGVQFSYAHTIPNAGVVFACVSNFFSGYYRENYKGGMNALKVLHNIICGFDNLLRKPLYTQLEKIKTINDCYMMASGLNTSKTYNDDHLIKLMLFTFDLKAHLNTFNDENIVGTSVFYLKIGYNFGPVTAGIIGTSKPLYDIWGDTVNVASRMYSTAPGGHTQVSEVVQDYLKDDFEFQIRGKVLMKGKGEIMTYLAIKPLEKMTTYENQIIKKR